METKNNLKNLFQSLRNRENWIIDYLQTFFLPIAYFTGFHMHIAKSFLTFLIISRAKNGV